MNLSRHWNLNPEIDFLNHGSFGATPIPVGNQRQALIEALERDPIEFLAPERQLITKLDDVRQRIAQWVGASKDALVFVRNSTDGVNAVMRSFPFEHGDEVIITDHGYNACNNAARFAADRSGASVRVVSIPFPEVNEDDVVDRITQAISPRTRLLLVDHVTSPTGLVFPVRRLVEQAKRHGVRVMVDGAHAPAMVPINLSELGADYYTANHHKWLCAPKASGFLYVAEAYREEVRPTVISHGANRVEPGRQRYQTEFDWVGTYDPTPILSAPAALDFLSSLYPGGLSELMDRNREKALAARSILSEALNIPPPAIESMIGSMAAVPLPQLAGASSEQIAALQRQLYDRHRFELPIFGWNQRAAILRVSLQAYNSIEQITRLGRVLRTMDPPICV